MNFGELKKIINELDAPNEYQVAFMDTSATVFLVDSINVDENSATIESTEGTIWIKGEEY